MANWVLGDVSTMTMAAGQGTLPWVELHERVSGKVFDVYLPGTLVGELTIEEFGVTVLEAVRAEAQLERELLALNPRQDHSIRWSSGDAASAYVRFTRKA